MTAAPAGSGGTPPPQPDGTGSHVQLAAELRHQGLERLGEARRAIAAIGGVEEAAALAAAGLDNLTTYLTKRPVVAVMGEINSGKTTVVNLLAGLSVLPTGVIATTAVPVRLRHGAAPVVLPHPGSPDLRSLRGIDVELPAPRLDAFDIFDLPASRDSDVLVRRADALVFTTLATRAWTEGERRTVAELPSRFAGQALLVATHADLLTPGERQRVQERLQREAGGRFAGIVVVDAREPQDVLGVAGGDPVMPEAEPADLAFVGRAELLARFDRIVVAVAQRRARRVERAVHRLARLSLGALSRLPEGRDAPMAGDAAPGAPFDPAGQLASVLRELAASKAKLAAR
ncbi:MAG: dynamin family protein [Hyphomicrobiaceae bacterium]|nr:dynamin family protein [Hyphomicrobiaceae bacterium]